MAELSLWLDYYDDIYSDFDSRNYQKRRVSEDFLHELRNALKYRKERVHDLVLLLPVEKRDEPNETAIMESLKSFFNAQFQAHLDNCRKKYKRGIFLGIAGILIMIFNSFISFKSSQSLPLVALRVLMEPAGWFLLWVSFDFLFYDWNDLKKEREFFRELSEMKIHFRSS
jgi:hypothetical protein